MPADSVRPDNSRSPADKGAPDCGIKKKIDQAMGMLLQGKSVSEVAYRFRTTTRTVRRWRQARYPNGMPTPGGPAEQELSATETANHRTDTADGQVGTDTADGPRSESSGDNYPFAADPEIVAVRRKAALERAEAERLRASLERREAEGDLREVEERERLRLLKVRRSERDWHRKTYQVLRQLADADDPDDPRAIELAGWHWHRSGGGPGNPYKDPADLRNAAWSQGWKAAEETDPTKAGRRP